MESKSSFTKKDKKEPETGKVFFGHPEIDGLLSNNVRAGAIVLLEEDHPTSLHLQLARYFVGSAFHLEEHCFIFDVFSERWRSIVPYKSSATHAAAKTSAGSAVSSSVAEEQQTSEIAWRYNTENIRLKDLDNFVSNELPVLDLSRAVEDGAAVDRLVHTFEANDYTSLCDLLRALSEQYQNSLRDEHDIRTRKILLTNLFSCFAKTVYQLPELARFLHALKTLARASHCVILLTAPPYVQQATKNLLYQGADFVLKVDALFEEEDFDQFHGLLHFLKVPAFNSFLSYRLDTLTWGLKAHSKKRLEIDRLYESPPPDFTPQRDKQEGSEAQHQGEEAQKKQTVHDIDF